MSTTPIGRPVRLVLVSALVLLLTACLPPVAGPGHPATALPGLLKTPPAPLARIDQGLTALRGPIPFPIEANVGQASGEVSHLMRVGGLTVGFRSGGLTYALQAAERGEPAERRAGPRSMVEQPASVRRWMVHQELVGARQTRAIGTVAAETDLNYLVGSPDTWRVGVPTFHQVAYQDAWPGITAAYQRDETGLKSSFHLAPGADPSRIRLAYRGGDVRLSEAGELEIVTPLGVLRESAPVAWQEQGGKRAPVAASWEILSGPGEEVGEAAFRLGTYDPTRPLVIDPSLLYATYLGGSGGTRAFAIAVDASGATYVTGETTSTEATFPNGAGFAALSPAVPGFDQTFNGSIVNAFVVKLAPDGRSLVYATYLGGSGGGGDSGLAIAIDGSGAAYVAGYASSTEATFPNGAGFAALTPAVPGFDQSYNGGQNDAFVVKLAPDGRSLAYATYLGGSGADFPNAIAVDGNGAAHVTGYTDSTQATFPNGSGFASLTPAVPGLDQTFNGSINDAFVVKLAPDGRTLAYATYLGSTGGSVGYGIAVDATGAAYVAGAAGDGFTAPTPAVPGFDQTYNGHDDAFAAKLAPDGRSLVYATYLGGSGDDVAFAIAIDGSGAAYVTGRTDSPQASFPSGGGFAALTPAVPGFDQTINGNEDVFVVKLGTDGRSLSYATYLGGNLDDNGRGIAVDASGAAYVAGSALSTEATFPDGDPNNNDRMDVPGFDQTFNGEGDGFVARIGPTARFTDLTASASLLNEGQQLTLLGTLIDPDATAAHTVLVFWGDPPVGQAQNVPLAAEQTTFQVTHTYADDVASTDVKAVLSSNGENIDTRFLPIQVRNVRPSLTNVAVSPVRRFDLTTVTVAVDGDIVDPGTDTFQVVVLWGDEPSSPPPTPTACTVNTRHFTCQHAYHRLAAPRTYTISLGVIDDDGGRGTATTTVNVPGSIGSFTLAPQAATVAVGDPQTYILIWTVPHDGHVWRNLNTIDLRFREGGTVALWLRWDEAANTFCLVDDDGACSKAGTPGSKGQLVDGPIAKLDPGASTVQGSGPTGQSVTLTLALSFKNQTAGHTYTVEAAATGDAGEGDNFEQGGTLTVDNRPGRPREDRPDEP